MRHYRLLSLALCLGISALLLQAPAGAAADIVLRAADASSISGAWQVIADPTAAGGARLSNPDQGMPKPGSPSATPANAFELTFVADAGTPYHLWIRGRAAGDSYDNDSVWVQFSDSLLPDGTAAWRIGTASAASVVLEDCSGCGVSGWGWQDNMYGGVAPPIYFAQSGPHTIRIQVREDGLSIDQIVLSSGAYLNAPPGPPVNDATILGGGTPPPPSSTLIRGPYLQQVTSHSAVVVWASREPGPASVQLGGQSFPATTTFFPSSTTGITDFYQHEAAVTGLAAFTVYPYRLFTGATPATDGSDRFRTAPETGTGRARFFILGDSGVGSSEQRALSARMDADNADFVLHAGDIAYGRPEGEGDASYATYQSWFFDVYAPWLRRWPFFPSMGNHDSRASNSWGDAYLRLFSLPPDAGAGPYPDHAERYYSFDWGPVHVVALDTELAFQDANRRAAQIAWLQADLAAAAAQPWKIAFYHRSPYSAGGEHGSDLLVQQTFGPLFERYGVQLSLSAHEHDYERTVPIRNSGAHAVTYLVSGGGGGPLYAAGEAAWTAVAASEHHYLRVTLDGCLATLEAVRASGSLLDSWVLDRCAQATDTAPPFVDFTNVATGTAVSGITPITADAGDDVRVEKVDLWVDGALRGIDRTAPYAFSWDANGVSPGGHTLELRAYDIAGNKTSRTAVVNVVPGSPTGLPDGWQSQDVGNIAQAGSASFSGGTYTITGSGADIWGNEDAFRYTYAPLIGDGVITARVSAMNGSEAWTKVGVMIRASTDPGSAHASMFASLSKGLAFQRRTSSGATSTHTAGPSAPAPMWVRLARTGNTVEASASVDGASWTFVGSDVIALPVNAFAGLAITSHTASGIASGVVDHVTVTSQSAPPPSWQAFDVGSVGVPGSTTESGGTFTVRGAGADIWGTADAFQFAARPLNGDGDIVARVVNVSGTQAWTKAGVMLRSSLDPASAHAFMLVSLGKGTAFQRRPFAGATSVNTSAGGAAPFWVKLTRQGATVTAFVSADGSSWTVVGSDAMPVGPLLAGLAVTNHDASQLAVGIFDNVAVTER